MPTLNSRGDVLAGFTGGGMGPIHVNGRVIHQAGSVPRWLDDDHVIFSSSGGVIIQDLRTNQTRTVVAQEVNWLEAGGGHWAVRAQATLVNGVWHPTPFYLDSTGRRNTTDYPLACTEAGIMVMRYEDSLDVRLYTNGAAKRLGAGPVLRGDADMDGDRYVFRTAPDTLAHNEGFSLVSSSADLALSWPFVVTSLPSQKTLAIFNLVTGAKKVLETDGFYPDILYDSGAGTIRIVYSTTTGERPSDIRSVLVKTDDVKVPPPPPPPERLEHRPFPSPKWIAPYHVITDRWGDDQSPVGNAHVLTLEAEDEPATKVGARALRAAAAGRPVFCQPDHYRPELASLVVGWYFHLPLLDGTVRTLPSHYPDAPFVLYVDQALGSKEWSEALKKVSAAYDPDLCWFSPQLYLQQGESLAEFEQRCWDTCEVIKKYGYNSIPTVQAYDRNGLFDLSTCRALVPIFEQLLQRQDVIGLLPFTSMRRGQVGNKPIGGLEQYPALKMDWEQLTWMNPEERPSRWSYWDSTFTPRRFRLKEKLRQDRFLVQLDREDKELLLGLLGD